MRRMVYSTDQVKTLVHEFDSESGLPLINIELENGKYLVYIRQIGGTQTATFEVTEDSVNCSSLFLNFATLVHNTSIFYFVYTNRENNKSLHIENATNPDLHDSFGHAHFDLYKIG